MAGVSSVKSGLYTFANIILPLSRPETMYCQHCECERNVISRGWADDNMAMYAAALLGYPAIIPVGAVLYYLSRNQPEGTKIEAGGWIIGMMIALSLLVAIWASWVRAKEPVCPTCGQPPVNRGIRVILADSHCVISQILLMALAAIMVIALAMGVVTALSALFTKDRHR